MDAKLTAANWRRSAILGALVVLAAVRVTAQAAAQPPAQVPPGTPTTLTLDQAIELALKRNHALQAARTTIDQGHAQEVTANLRPNPVFLGDLQFLPIFSPSNFTGDYFDNGVQFDLGVSYLFERGKKRQHRLEAAQDQTAVTVAQVTDTERTLTFNVASQFIAAQLAQANLELADADLASFRQTLDIMETRMKDGAMSEGDFIKIHLQQLQFEMDVSAAKLARLQALASLRQLLGYESVPEGYQVAGDLAYQPVTVGQSELQAMAMRLRPDLRAAQLAVTAAKSQLSLAQANGKKDINAQFNYTHVASLNTGALFANIQIPVFDRNQGEIARTRSVITQSEELSSEQASIALTDVANAFEGLHTSDQVVQLYQSGYLKNAEDSRDISKYAYERGAGSLLDFLDAERTYRSTQLAYRQSLAGYMVALEQLRQAVGTRSLP